MKEFDCPHGQSSSFFLRSDKASSGAFPAVRKNRRRQKKESADTTVSTLSLLSSMTQKRSETRD